MALLVGLASCVSSSSDSANDTANSADATTATNEGATGLGESDDDTYNGLPIPSLPITGYSAPSSDTDENDIDGAENENNETTDSNSSSTSGSNSSNSDSDQPEPPPLHAVLSVVVRYETSWAPYFGADMLAIDESGMTSILAQLAQVDAVLTEHAIPASFEFAYGPANALCELHPHALRTLISHGHSIGISARTNGEVFRATEAFRACGIAPRTLSGLATMADPPGPKTTTATGLANAMSIASIRSFQQVTGVVSPVCEELNLASATNQYGTGAFTAPWRSAWTDGNACNDKISGQIVVIDQVQLGSTSPEGRITPGQYTTAEKYLTQALGWAADHRYREASELPAPGMFSWGVTLRLADLVESPEANETDNENGNEADNETENDEGAINVTDGATDPETDKGNGGTSSANTDDRDGENTNNGSSNNQVEPEMPTPAAPEPPTRLNSEALEALSSWLEGFSSQVEAHRLIWVPPGWIGATLRAAA
ncbi:MAG: hypothetical protein WC184_10865 [Acidimicrobiia bacterium]